MATAQEILISMGIDPDEAIQADKELTSKPRGDRRICLCGHSVNRHDLTVGRPVCQIGKQFCGCRNLQPVLEAQDTRPFIRKTTGSALNHALTRGIAAAIENGQELNWIDGVRYCHKCQNTEEGLRLTPMVVTANGVPADYDTGFNALFCDECRASR